MRRLACLLLAATALGSAGGSAAWADIVIATTGPMTGQYAAFGEQMRRGAELAVKNINDKGGVLGQKLALKIGDDACDPKQAVAVANQMVNDKIVFMAGHFCSGSSIPASDVYREEGILQISPASTNPQFTERGYENVFRTCGRDDQQGLTAANYVVDNKVGTKIAIIHDKSAYGKGLADEFKKQLNARGVKEVMYEAITQGDKDFSALTTKMKSAGTDLIYLGGYHTEAGLITRQAKDQGLAAKLMSGDALVTDEYWQITGDSGAGTLMTFPPDPRNDPNAADAVAAFKAAGFDPEGYTLYTYAAIQVFAQAAERAKSTELEKLLPVLHEMTFPTVTGAVKFDTKGDRTGNNYLMYVWRDGTYKAIN